MIKEITEGDGLPATISGSNTGTVFGHAMTPGAISSGAVSAAETPAFGVNPAVSESFSSSGAGTELLFASNGTALASPDELSPVVVSGIDDINTTVPGGLGDFYGTSAASASLAGAAALILSANPNLTPAQVEQLMEETALPMANAAVSGAGLVQIDPAVADARAMQLPQVSATNETVADNQSIPLTELFSVTGAAATQYQIWFSWAQAGHPALGEVTDNGTPIAIDQWVTVSSLSGLDYLGGATTGTDEIWLEASNAGGSTQAQADVTDTGIAAPMITATNETVADNQSIPLTELFSVTGGAATQYQIWFSWAQAGHPALGEVTDNGTPIAIDQWVTVSSLSGLDYVGGATTGTDEIWLKAANGGGSTQAQANITDQGIAAPMITATNETVADNQSIPLTELFSVTGGAATRYQIWFSWAQAGHPALGEVTNNGTPIAIDQWVTALKSKRSRLSWRCHHRH